MGLISMAKWLASQVFDAQDELDADLHDDPHGLVDLQVGKRVFNDAPASMRTELWLSQLHREGGRGAAAARQYSALLRKVSARPLVCLLQRAPPLQPACVRPSCERRSCRRQDAAAPAPLLAAAACDGGAG